MRRLQESDEVHRQAPRDPGKKGRPSVPLLRMQQRHIGAVVRPRGARVKATEE